MGNNAFSKTAIREVAGLGEITALPDGTLGCFGLCTSLAKVTLPETLTYLGMNTFNGTTSLSEMNFPLNLEVIGQYAFRGSSFAVDGLSSGSIRELKNYAFTDADVTGEVNLPNLETIGYGAFSGTGIIRVLDLGKITELTEKTVMVPLVI